MTNWCIYLNREIFRDAGLDPEKDYPKTWEDIVTVFEKIVSDDGKTPIVGEGPGHSSSTS